MTFMNKLPTVISCCFCCFLRAGTVMISIFSFIVGLLFAPNANNVRGFWDMDPVLSNYSQATETAVQMILGVISIILCIASIMLLIGACCNMPILIEVYQWSAMVYTSIVVILFFILAMFCFFAHSNCFLAGCVLVALIFCFILFTAYFIIVVNSLRMSLKYLASDEFSVIA
ncbi:hypothetical protein K1T71_013714 [Dendrolimus kikuchii]|uniref:Uncharacterized protein n=1 Tax=Dendrolimus kikuchii TaxID=765133 RepID=A0ACC1CH94_9NEOP|nr:hypothetical protein K1T71_013714 [Dendrolimus kikuchii]